MACLVGPAFMIRVSPTQALESRFFFQVKLLVGAIEMLTNHIRTNEFGIAQQNARASFPNVQYWNEIQHASSEFLPGLYA